MGIFADGQHELFQNLQYDRGIFLGINRISNTLFKFTALN